MTKEEFKGFSSAAQHDMVLEALVRVTKNLETMEKDNGKPFVGTVKQRRNDIKLLTILAEAFGKNELVWDQKSRVTVDAGKYIPDKVYITTGVMHKNPFDEIMAAKDKFERAQQRFGHFMVPESTDHVSYKEMAAVNDRIERARRSSGNVKESRDEDRIEGKVLFQRCSGNFDGRVDCKENEENKES